VAAVVSPGDVVDPPAGIAPPEGLVVSPAWGEPPLVIAPPPAPPFPPLEPLLQPKATGPSASTAVNSNARTNLRFITFSSRQRVPYTLRWHVGGRGPQISFRLAGQRS
jgi:hypothetical protein